MSKGKSILGFLFCEIIHWWLFSEMLPRNMFHVKPFIRPQYMQATLCNICSGVVVRLINHSTGHKPEGDSITDAAATHGPLNLRSEIGKTIIY